MFLPVSLVSMMDSFHIQALPDRDVIVVLNKHADFVPVSQGSLRTLTSSPLLSASRQPNSPFSICLLHCNMAGLAERVQTFPLAEKWVML